MGSKPKLFLAAACVAAIALSGARLAAFYQQRAAEAALYTGAPLPPKADPNGFAPVQVVAPFPAITNAPIARAAEIVDEVADAELVLGVALGGESRAYPINMLTNPTREIINDRLGGRAIAATW